MTPQPLRSRVPPTKPARVPWSRLALLLLACAVLRGFLILAPPDDYFERGEVPHEELLRGTAAQELLDGPLAPIQRYQVNNFWGGSLVVSMLATAPYAIFGPRIVALRLVALVFGLACVAILFLMLHRHAGARAAWIGAVLLAFAPPGYAMSSGTLYGTHVEANALALLVAWAFLENRAAERGPYGARRTWSRFLLGAAAGFALWFGFSLVLVLAVWLLHELAVDRAFFARRRVVPIAAGFLVGFWPWIRYQLVHGWSGLDVYDAGLVSHLTYGLSRGRALEKLLDSFTRTGPGSLCFRDTLLVDGLWVGRALVCLAAAAVVRCAWVARADLAALRSGLVRGMPGARATPATFALGFLLLFALTYLLSAFDAAGRDWIFDWRYLMPPVPFVCIAAAIAGAELSSRGPAAARRVTVATCAIALACAIGTVRQARPSRFEANLSTPGASSSQLVRFLVRSCGPYPEEAVTVAARILARREGARRDELLAGFGRGLRFLSVPPPGAERPESELTDEERTARRRAAACARSLEAVARSLPADAQQIFAGDDRLAPAIGR